MTARNPSDRIAAVTSALAAFFLWILYRLYFKTLDIRVVNEGLPPARLPDHESAIFVFWHSKSFVILPLCSGLGVGVLTLDDWKNSVYDKICKRFGYRTIPARNAYKATSELSSLLRQRHHVGLAVDGPKGPAGIVRPGALFLSETTGQPGIAVRILAEKSFRLKKRWDRYEIPLPFSRVSIETSEPFRVSSKDRVFYQKKVKDYLSGT